jgi:hypothetical protein
MATPAKNLNALLVGTIEFAFSDGAISAADAKLKGFRDVGNVVGMTPNLEPTVIEHYGSYRGVRRRDKTIHTENKLEFTVRLDQWDQQKVEWLFGAGAGTAHTQAVLSGVAGEVLAFGTTPSDSSKWYDLRTAAGARVRKLTAVTIATLVEGTDFEVDLEVGRIRFLTPQTGDLTPTLTAPAITSADAGYFAGLTPMADVRKSGFGRLICYDQYDGGNAVVWDYVDFSCEVSVESAGEIDGQNPAEITLKVRVTDVVGNLLVRKANTP